MKNSNVLILLIYLQFIFEICAKPRNLSEKLILTPFILAGQLDQARNLSRVDLGVDVESYSGYLNINKTFGSNLFFWFFPSQSKGEDAPLVLWLQGGPGTSSMFGLFVENGPFSVDEKLKLNNRKNSWTQNNSVIYIDSPVGSGFSFTESDDGYSTTQDEIASNLYEALTQFFLVFPEYQTANFFVAGESYAGKYVPKLSLKIHEENQNKPLVYINYQGMAIGAGFSDPISMVDSYGEYYNSMGLINQEARKHFDEIARQTKILIEQGNYSHAAEIQDELIGGDIFPYPTYFKNKTGFDFYYNILETKLPTEHTYYIKFLEQNFVQQALHVGRTTFFNQSIIVPKYLKDDIFKSVKSTIEVLLNLKYKTLLYVGQFDMIVTHLAVNRFIDSMKWQEKLAFEQAERKVWNVDNEIAGYVQQSENLIYVVVRKAGHNVPYDMPRVCNELIYKFTRKLNLVS